MLLHVSWFCGDRAVGEMHGKLRERTYYLELVQQIFEGFRGDKRTDAERNFQQFTEAIRAGKMDGTQIEVQLDKLCTDFNMRLDKEALRRKREGYMRSREEMDGKMLEELQSLDAALRTMDNTMRNSVNFVDNTILPQLSAVFVSQRIPADRASA